MIGTLSALRKLKRNLGRCAMKHIFSRPLQKEQYFSVTVNNETHIILARSDYHAAFKVKKETGHMAFEDDVCGPFSSEPSIFNVAALQSTAEQL